MTNLFHRATDGSHGDHDPEYRRDDPESRQPVRRSCHRHNGRMMLFFKHMNLCLQKRLQIGCIVAFHRALQSTCHEFHQMVVIGDFRILFESGVVMSFGKNRFPRQHSIASCNSKQFVMQLEDLVVGHFPNIASFQRGDQTMDQVLDHF